MFSASALTEVSAETVGVAIAAPPTDGEANMELIRYLAEVLELKKSHISLDKVPQNNTNSPSFIGTIRPKPFSILLNT